METRTIFFMGKPGSGKGTQAKLLSEKTGWQVITAGDQFRAIAEEDTPVGRKVKSEIDAGMLAPHWLAMHLYLKSLFLIEGSESAIFDGFNRKVQEADIIIDSLRWIGRPFKLLNIVISDDEVRHRLNLRRDIEDRTDDNAIEERLTEYRIFTKPAIERFRAVGDCIEIDGELTREAVASHINKALRIK